MTCQRLPAGSLPRRGESVSDRLVRFPGQSRQEIEAMPEPLRWTIQRTIFHLLDEPVRTLADPFPHDDPLPGAYELHLPADHVTIWYIVSAHECPRDHQYPASETGHLTTWAGTARLPPVRPVS
jgi:hypothetical protein